MSGRLSRTSGSESEVPKLVRVLKGVIEVKADAQFGVRFVLEPTKNRKQKAFTKARGSAIGIKDHKSHAPTPTNKAKAWRPHME